MILNPLNKETLEEARARKFFEGQGFTVEPIKVGHKKSPDFMIKDRNGTCYLLEVKGRFDNMEIQKELSEAEDNSDDIVHRLRQVGPNRDIEQIIYVARNQFRSLDVDHQHIWLLWLAACDDLSPDLTFNQFVYTLYGTRHVIFKREGDTGERRECYYARQSAFEYWPELDGALVTMVEGASFYGKFCLNEFSPNFDFLRKGKLSEWFRTKRALVDPRDDVALGQLAVDSSSVDRSDESKLLQYLRNRFNNPQLSFCDFVSFRGMGVMRVPKFPRDPDG